MDHSTECSIDTSNINMMPTNHRGASSSRAFKKAANASYGSVRTAATSLLGDRSDTQSRDHSSYADLNNSNTDSLLLWEGLEEEEDELDPSSGHSYDEYGVSHTSLDFDEHDLDELNKQFHMDDTFHDSYSLGKSLGQGSFGSVRRCTSKDSSRNGKEQSFAVKSVPLDKYDPEEIEILQYLQECPHIVQVQEVFHDHTRGAEDQVMIVMEELTGGDLLERIAAKECYTETEAKQVFRTLLRTVQFCHEQGIAHCDIKPENIMLALEDNDTDIKLVDFGLARRFRDANGTVERLMEMHGSPEYAAPEVFNRDEVDGGDGYDERCDIWSCGVVLYVLLGGYGPFEADTPEDMIKEVAKGQLKFHKKYWKNISREAKILIARMLTVDPDKRCSLEEAMSSPWFAEEEEG